jgi:hypothetical protein
MCMYICSIDMFLLCFLISMHGHHCLFKWHTWHIQAQTFYQMYIQLWTMDVHIDDMFMFAFCFSQLAGVGTGCCRDWLLQWLACRLWLLFKHIGLIGIRPYPPPLPALRFPFPAGLRGAAAAAAAGSSSRAAPSASAAAGAAAGAGAGAGAGAASAASAGAAESSPAVSSSGVGPNQ